MKSILLGFLAAVIGCVIFFLCLAGWYQLTGQGSGVAGRASSEEGTVIVVAQDSAGQGAAGSGTAAQGSGSGTGGGSGTAAQGSGSGSGSGSGTSSGAGMESSSDASSAGSSSQAPGTVSEEAVNDYMDTIRRELAEQLGGGSHLNVERSARGITITIWEDELVDRLSAGQKDESTETLWNEKKDELRRISQTYAGRSASAGITNTHVVANLLNERNRSDIILSYEDGTLVHDGLDHN